MMACGGSARLCLVPVSHHWGFFVVQFKDEHCYPKRKRHLRSLGFKSYAEYRKSDLWKTVRTMVFKAKGPTCLSCRSRPATEVHHGTYDLAVLVGADLRPLYPVCRECHKEAEFDGDRKRNVMEATAALGFRVRKYGQGSHKVTDRELARQRTKLRKQWWRFDETCLARFEDDGGPARDIHFLKPRNVTTGGVRRQRRKELNALAERSRAEKLC